jgi:uncharacterized protein involved in exopolysaccharide biosynthesis
MLQRTDLSHRTFDEFHFDVMSVLHRRLRLLVALPLVFLLLSLLALRLLPNHYSVTTVLWLKPEFALSADGQAQPDRLGQRQQAGVYELKSLPVFTALVTNLSLDKEPEFADQLKPRQGLARLLDLLSWFVVGSYPVVPLSAAEENTIKTRRIADLVRQKLHVAPEGTERIALTYTAKQPRLAYDIALGVAEEYLRTKSEERRDRLEFIVYGLRQRISFLRTRLDEQSRTLLLADSARLAELERAVQVTQHDVIISVPPVVPIEPSRPSAKLIATLALFAGFACAIFILMVLEIGPALRKWIKR